MAGALAWLGLVWLLLRQAFPGWSGGTRVMAVMVSYFFFMITTGLLVDRRVGSTVRRIRYFEPPDDDAEATPGWRWRRVIRWTLTYGLGYVGAFIAVVNVVIVVRTHARTGTLAWTKPAVTAAVSGGYVLVLLIWLVARAVRTRHSAREAVEAPEPEPFTWTRPDD
jgi:hypothetical protein